MVNGTKSRSRSPLLNSETKTNTAPAETEGRLSAEDEDAIASALNRPSASEDNNEKLSVDPKYRLDTKRIAAQKNLRPIEKKGTVKGIVVTGSLAVLMVLGLKFVELLKSSPNLPRTEIPSSSKKPATVDFSKPPKLDYQAKYALKDQQLEIENFGKPTPSKVVEEKTPPQPKPEIQPISQPTPITNQPIMARDSSKRRKIDPIKLYARATNMGVYGRLNTVSRSRDRSSDAVVQSQNNRTPSKAKISLTIENYEKQLPIGSKTKGVLLDPISGMDGESLEERNYIVEIEENLSSPSGEVILGAGTQLICKVTSLSSDGYLQLTPIALQMISQSTRSIVRNLTPGQILINADNGRLLKAQVRKPDTLPQDVMAAMLSGASSAAQIMNRPRSRRTHVAGGFTETIDNGEANVGIAALGGFSESMSKRMERRVEAEKEWLSKNPAVFFLQAGTKVEIYINQAFSL